MNFFEIITLALLEARPSSTYPSEVLIGCDEYLHITTSSRRPRQPRSQGPLSSSLEKVLVVKKARFFRSIGGVRAISPTRQE